MKLHRLLLLLYPESFRADYGAEIDAVFEQHSRHAGGIGRVGLWADAIGDALTNGPALHLDILRQDVRDALRAWAQAPAFSLTVVLVATIAIGATTAVFSLADHVLIRPLPFPDASRLVKLWQDQSYRGYGRLELSPPMFRDWKANATSFAEMAAYSSFSSNLLAGREPQRVDGVGTLGSLFSVLGTAPALGRGITEGDGRIGAPSVVVLSDRLWRRTFAANPAIVGRDIIIDGLPWTVVGVMPPSFEFPNRIVDIWIAYQFPENVFQDWSNFMLQSIARLRPGATMDDAKTELDLLVQRRVPEVAGLTPQSRARVLALRDEIPQQSRLLLWVLAATSGAMLLIACANLASLFLMRLMSRHRELAVRTALGAAGSRLVRQLLTESVMLAVASGIAGIALAVFAVQQIAVLVPSSLPIADAPAVDLRMLAAAGLATIITIVGLGVLPAFRARRLTTDALLRVGARQGVDRHTQRMRSILVTAEITACVALLVASGLLLRALVRVQQTDPGFEPANVLTLRTALPTPKYRETATRMRFYNDVLDNVRALPGVTSAAYTSWLPMTFRGGIWPVAVDGKPEDPATPQTVSLREITPQFFAAMGVPMLRGRDFADGDTRSAPLVAIVSESFVRRHWPTQDPIGRRVFLAFNERVVIGVVGDIRVRGLERESEPQVYVAAAQMPDSQLVFYSPRDLVVKSAVPELSIVPAVRAIIAKADPEQPVSDIRPLGDIVASDTAPRRTQVRVIGAFTAIALLLAATGLYGLLAFYVSTHVRDIGVRLALGAERRTIVALIVGGGARLAVIGVVIGSILAAAGGRLMQGLLADVSPRDPLTFVAASGVVLLITLVATTLPALRAAAVDPLNAIRHE